MRCYPLKVNYQYASQSMCLSEENGQTTLGFSPDLSREENVSFLGHLKDPLVFRDAMLMLREIVILDTRPKKKDRVEYFSWLAEEIEKRVISKEEEMEQKRKEIHHDEHELIQKRSENIKEINKLKDLQHELQTQIDSYNAWGDYNKLERDFWKFIRDRDYDLWFVLDPVITVHNDQVSFEAFSLDESTYGCLSIPMESFELLQKPSLGTTNIDFSEKLAQQMKRFRTYSDVTLSVNPKGFTVDTGIVPEHIEKKIDLPETWIKGFNEVSAAACLEGISITLTPADFYDICSVLHRYKEKHSPRYMKWILEPEQPIQIIFEPFSIAITLHAIYHGKKKREEKIWGRRRWLCAESLIPIAKSFEIRLFGFGMPQFIIADLHSMKMTIGFTSWSANDWVKGTAFHIMAGFTSEGNYEEIYQYLKEKRCGSIEDISNAFPNESHAFVRSGIGMLLRKGEGYYDTITNQIRFRQLCNTPIPEELYEVTDAERLVMQHMEESMDSFTASVLENGNYKFTHSLPEIQKYNTKRMTKTELIFDDDGQIVKVSCDCREFKKGSRNISSPCSHVLALYMLSVKFLKLSFQQEKIYKINDIMEMLL